MKRKLFTLLFALVALASFQVNAQVQKYLIWSANYENASNTGNPGDPNGGTLHGIPDNLPGSNWPTGANVATDLHYAKLANLGWPAHLDVADGGTWKWVDGKPINTGTKFILEPTTANRTKFTTSDGSETLKLKFIDNGIELEYSDFVIFTSNAAASSFTIHGAWAQNTQPDWLKKTIEHAGYLSVNTAANPKDGKLIIVVVNKETKALELKTVEYLRAHLDKYAPFAFFAEKPEGHWATTCDFDPNKYYDFDNLKVADAEDLDGDKYNTFKLTQVDWVGRLVNNVLQGGTLLYAKEDLQSGENIFGYTGETVPLGGSYYVPKFEGFNGGGAKFGTQQGAEVLNTAKNDVIPLFILSAPEDECKVVSVSRKNDLRVQSKPDGGYGNKLELRDFGTYYDYDEHSTSVDESTYGPIVASKFVLWDNSALGTGAPKLNEWRVATSLQKFAIWIDEDGNKSIYPLATYSWKYGIEKYAQKSTVLPNSVIMYNNPLVDVAVGSTVADKSWGIKIDVWETGATNTPVSGEIVTGPNIIQTMSEYVKDYYFNEEEYKGTAGAIEGRFFFLNAQIPDNKIPTGVAAFGTDGYQEYGKTEYVLSTQMRNGVKQLVALPKERVRKADNQDDFWYDVDIYKRIEGGDLLPDLYWHNNPYDSVNMAAHWAIFKTQESPDKYMLVNMLGDTLRYLKQKDESRIYGGYSTNNSKIATARTSGTNIPYQGYFSPEGASTSGRWFGTWEDTSGSNLGFETDYEWEISAVPGHDGQFILKLGSLSLAIDGIAYQGNTTAVGTDTYYQYDIKLAPITAGAASCDDPLNTWEDLEDNGFSCTGGLLLQKKEIYYVPNFSASYGDEDKDDPNHEFINTGDLGGNGKFDDKYAKVYNDSLTAYLLLDGTYAIKEAEAVGNGLLLSPEQVGATGILAAALATNGQYPEEETAITFIPLAQSGRTKAIRTILNAPGQLTSLKTNAAVDTLYGETYKWFVVKDHQGRYLRFDTIAPNASVNQQKVGFIFDETSIANATPIRLYQPLVGDKLQGNFIIQFQLPVNTYDEVNPVTHSYKNIWPNLTGTGAWPQNAAANATSNVGRRLFGELYQQSNYILGTVDPAKATRFTYVPEHFDPQDCCEETFVTPQWMAQEKILGLPVANEIWTKIAGESDLAGINKGFGQTAANGDEAVIVDGNTTELIHEYAGKIINGKFNNEGPVIFQTDVTVPLYRIKLNTEDGKYLTVGTTTYQYVSGSTQDPDVTGVNLIWADINTTGTQKEQALQLFAISGPESGPDSEDWYAECSPYVYLPVASYKVNYKTGNVITAGADAAIYYNVNLGMKGEDCNKNDITKVFRVGQYSPSYRDVKNLVVNNALGIDAASFVPVEVKWKKQIYDQIECNYKLVKNVNTVNSTNYYYAAGTENQLCEADKNTILAHWQTPLVDEDTDDRLYQFVPETILGYGSAITGIPEDLEGTFYFRIIDQDAAQTTVIAFNFKDYEDQFIIGIDTFEIRCVEHALPFADLEKKYTDKFSYVLPSQLAILEAPSYVNRNLAMSTKTINPTPINNNASYQVYINPFEGNIKDAQYLSAYKTYSRFLAENDDETDHEIPYYAFSIKKDGREYFLNVHPKTDPSYRDSVYWSLLSEADSTKLIDGDAYTDENLKFFQFCLPYQLDKNGNRKETYYPEESDNKFYPTYLQTLDLGREDYPYLVVTGASSQYVTARRLNEAMHNNNTECTYTNGYNSLEWNIYTVDYSQIDSLQVTAWIFAGEQPGEHEWVPLRNADGVNPFDNTDPDATIADFDTDGSLTNYLLYPAGTTFVAESRMDDPCNYGILLGKDVNKVKLHFEFRGKEEIGTLWKVPIYYYQIQAPQAPAGSGDWLTDADGAYTYNWVGKTYDYAFFGPKLTDMVDGTVDGTSYDSGYLQTFGLLYYNKETGVKGDYKNPEQTFVVVSSADFRNPQQNYDYRYLAEVNGRMVFVKNIDNALVFQFGRITGNDYTNINAVGQGEVFGVSGGVRVLNQTGAVGLYTIDGRLIKSVDVTSADQTITAPRGIVIVKADGKATKVVVK